MTCAGDEDVSAGASDAAGADTAGEDFRIGPRQSEYTYPPKDNPYASSKDSLQQLEVHEHW